MVGRRDAAWLGFMKFMWQNQMETLVAEVGH